MNKSLLAKTAITLAALTAVASFGFGTAFGYGGGGGGGGGIISGPLSNGYTNTIINQQDQLNILNLIISEWGQTGPSLPGDLNNDGVVNVLDLNLLLAQWTS